MRRIRFSMLSGRICKGVSLVKPITCLQRRDPMVLKVAAWTTILACAALAPSALGQSRLYVNEASAAGNGESWATAFTHPETAIAQALGLGTVTEIWVATGTYTPVRRTDPADPRSVTFFVPEGIAIIGGFAGHEMSLGERDIAANPTVFSGDLNGDDEPSFIGYDENARRVLTAAPILEPLVIDGIIFAHGFSAVPSVGVSEGAGIWVKSGGLEMDNCTVIENLGTGLSASVRAPVTIANSDFIDNWGKDVGGAFVGAELITVRSCRFESNRSEDNGGGMRLSLRDLAVIESCEFVDNSSKYLGGGLYVFKDKYELRVSSTTFVGNQSNEGGGLFARENGPLTLTDCEFRDNQASFVPGVGGGVGGGLVAEDVGDVNVVDCRFIGNSASRHGGGMYKDSCDTLNVYNSKFIQNTSLAGSGGGIGGSGSTETDIVQCLFAGNVAGLNGGALVLSQNHQLNMLTMSTVYANQAGASGGGVYSLDALNTVSNCVIWNNQDIISLSPEYAQISGIENPINNCVEGWTGAMGGSGNFGQDPIFSDPLGPDGIAGTQDDDLSLATQSPCIDSGNNNEVPSDRFDADGDGDTNEPLPLDLNGDDRFIDDPSSLNTGVGTAPIVDMGSFEYQLLSCYADCDQSTGAGVLDIFDFLCFQDLFVAGDPYACDCDLSTGIGVCDVFDFLCFQNQFVSGCP